MSAVAWVVIACMATSLTSTLAAERPYNFDYLLPRTQQALEMLSQDEWPKNVVISYVPTSLLVTDTFGELDILTGVGFQPLDEGMLITLPAVIKLQHDAAVSVQGKGKKGLAGYKGGWRQTRRVEKWVEIRRGTRPARTPFEVILR